MSPELAGAIGLIVLVVLLFARMWIGAAMALVGFVGYTYVMGLRPAYAVISQIPFTTIAWYPMSTVPESDVPAGSVVIASIPRFAAVSLPAFTQGLVD